VKSSGDVATKIIQLSVKLHYTNGQNVVQHVCVFVRVVEFDTYLLTYYRP